MGWDAWIPGICMGVGRVWENLTLTFLPLPSLAPSAIINPKQSKDAPKSFTFDYSYWSHTSVRLLSQGKSSDVGLTGGLGSGRGHCWETGPPGDWDWIGRWRTPGWGWVGPLGFRWHQEGEVESLGIIRTNRDLIGSLGLLRVMMGQGYAGPLGSY